MFNMVERSGSSQAQSTISGEPIEEAQVLVNFEGPNDPEMAANWPRSRKWLIVSVLAAMSFIVALGSSIAAPGVNQAVLDFNQDSQVLGPLIVSVYNVGLAIGPLLVAPVSELYGRLIPYHVTNVLFTLFTVGCAASPTLWSLILFRLLAGMESSAVLTVGGATVGDLFIQGERGRAMAAWTFGPLMGPAIGPVLGGIVTELKGWRWVFWIVSIVAAAITMLFFIVVPETYPPTILQRKVKRLKQQTGNNLLKSSLDDGLRQRERVLRCLRRPFVLLFRSPIVLLFSIFVAVVYSYQFILFVTIPTVFDETYGFSLSEVGLAYTGIAVGLLIGNMIFGYASDRVLSRKSQGKEPKPEYRLPLMIPAALCIPACLFIYGWTVLYKVHWIVPIFATSLLGIGLNLSLMSVQTYLVDAYIMYSASALAALAVLRSLLGAFLPLAGPPLYEALGLGWGNSTLGFIALALVPVPFLFMRYGEAIRTNSRYQPSL